MTTSNTHNWILPSNRKLVAERKKVDGLAYSQTSTPEGVPLPSYRYGRERVAHHKQRNSSDKENL